MDISVLADLLSGPGAPQIDFAAILATVSAAITAGNISGAVKAVTSGLSAPLTQISKALFTPEFQAFVTGKVGTVLGALPEILRAAVQKIVGIDIKPLIDALSGLMGGILPGASTVAAPRALSAAAAPVVVGLTAIKPAAAADVPAVPVAPEVAPAAPAEAPAAKAAAELLRKPSRPKLRLLPLRPLRSLMPRPPRRLPRRSSRLKPLRPRSARPRWLPRPLTPAPPSSPGWPNPARAATPHSKAAESHAAAGAGRG